MFVQLVSIVLAAIAGLTAAPPEFLGQQGAASYGSFLEAQVRLDRVRVAGACAAITSRWQGRDRAGGNNIPPDLVAASATGDVVIEHVSVTGCGRTTRHNLIVYRQRSGGWMSVALPGGNSLASPVLTRDTMTAAVRAVVQLSPNAPCPTNSTLVQRFRFGEIRLVSPPNHGVWSEMIPLQYCGVDRSMQVTYTSTPDGGADYSLRPLFATGPTGR